MTLGPAASSPHNNNDNNDDDDNDNIPCSWSKMLFSSVLKIIAFTETQSLSSSGDKVADLWIEAIQKIIEK